MYLEVTLAEFKRLMKAGLLVWPPFHEPTENRVYAVRIESEDNPLAFVYYVVV